MQPYNYDFAQRNLTPQANDIRIGKNLYRADISRGWVMEKGPKRQIRYKIDHALGGKNVYYFLASFPGGRLQTLPVAYDVKKKSWFDTAASGVRHFPGEERGQTVNWKDPSYTFNTGCYNCHVSQLKSGYDLKTDTYKTTWQEPGINCETCHGPSAEHNRFMQAAPKGHQPKDYKIISVKKFSPEQHNAACSGCHAKMSPITPVVEPGGRFFDHYDLVTLENPDYYPDGRDLGENYTYTSWLMSPCAKAGKINCVSCHTSSGRYRFKSEEKSQAACLPCHEKQVKNASAHSHHSEGSPGNKCISCHMPMTSFARMNRTDHSMLPPTPAATIAFKSPNACNLCHADKDAAWADKHVRVWRSRDYQAPVLKRATLIEAARKRDWTKLPAMLDYIGTRERDEVFTTSLLRMVPSSGNPKVIPVLLAALKDPSPLVRSAAADVFKQMAAPEAVKALLTAAGDEYRLVRIRATSSLLPYSNLQLSQSEKKTLETANAEFLASLTSRPDQWFSYYNLGNYYMDSGEPQAAIRSYGTALKLEPRAALVLVNASLAYARLGQPQKAESSLNRALKIAPDSAAANFNMGLLRAEQKDFMGAEKYLKLALQHDPQMAQAAYNLCVSLAEDRIDQSLTYCRKAAELRPENPRYAYTLAYFLYRKGEKEQAEKVLEKILEIHPQYRDALLLKREMGGAKVNPQGGK